MLDGEVLVAAAWLVAAAAAAEVSVMARQSAGWSQIFFRTFMADSADPVLFKTDRTVFDLRKAR